jgi:HEAT repeat protein
MIYRSRPPGIDGFVIDLEALLEALTSGDDARAEGAVTQLAKMGASASKVLTPLLDSPDSDHRWWVVRALAAIDDPLGWDTLREALHDPDPAVRQCAALGLRKRPMTSAVSGLIEALEDPDRLVARLASDALAAIGQDAIGALTKAMASPDAGVRIETVRALANIDNPQAIPPLLAALNDTSFIVEFWAEQGLERLGVGMVFFNP